MAFAKLRLARATSYLKATAKMYVEGLGLEILSHFEDHDGFDGIILGHSSAPYHFEFTQEKGVSAPKSLSSENLIVFYLPDSSEWAQTQARMRAAGFREVRARNPYWDANGITFEDLEGYRIVLAKGD